MFASGKSVVQEMVHVCVAVLLLTAAPATRAADEAPATAQEQAQTGDLTLTFKERCPQSAPADMTKRMGLKADEVADDYDLASQKFNAYVPADYSAGSPMGLLVFRGNGEPIPAALKPLFDQAHLIFVAMNATDSSWKDSALLLDIAANVGKQYTIDPKRIYLLEDQDSHFAAYGAMDVYTGVISMTKAVYPGTLKFQSAGHTYSVFPHDTRVLDASLLKTARQRAWVLLLNPNPSQDDLEQMTVSGMQSSGFTHVKAMQVPGEDKQFPNIKPDWLKSAIAFLDGASAKTKPRIATSAPVLTSRPTVALPATPVAATPPVNRAKQMLSLAKSYIDAGRADLAKAKLNDVITQYPNDPAATEAKQMLAKLGG